MEFNEVLQFVLNFVMSDNFFLLIWNQLRSNCFINLIIKSFYKLSLLRVLINRSFSTGLNLCPVDNTIGFPNTYQPDIKWIIRWTARTIKLLNRPGAEDIRFCVFYIEAFYSEEIKVATIAIGWRTILQDNPLSPKSDQHEISPCKIQCFVKQSGYEDYGHDHTRLTYLIFYQLLATTSVGNE